ncbi:membrane-associated phospholipid phosphatase [Novosphingobium gossypii]
MASSAALSGFSFTRNSLLTVGFYGLFSILSARRRANDHPVLKFALRFLNMLLLFTIIGMVGAVASYVSMKHSIDFKDGVLHEADRFIGFDWLGVREWVTSHPALLVTLSAAYFTHIAFPPIIIGVLCIKEMFERLYFFMTAFGVSLTITVLVSFFFPARAAFVYYNDGSRPANADHFDRIIQGITDGSLTAIDLQDLGGIITFPSFHATMAIIFAWALWPFAASRPITIFVATLLSISAIPIGGHYFVDILGGSLVAVAALCTVRTFFHRTPPMDDVVTIHAT